MMQNRQFLNRLFLAYTCLVFVTDHVAASTKIDWKRYFNPAPGTELRVNARESRDLLKPELAGKIRGWITITPPKKQHGSKDNHDKNDQCLTIEKSHELPDERICKPSKMAFYLKDIDKNGFLKWKVALPGQVDRTPIQWPTPYRIAQTQRYNQPPSDPPTYFFIESCEKAPLTIGQDKLRRLKLNIFGGKPWIIYFPSQDFALPKLPEQDQFGMIQGSSSESATEQMNDHIVLVDPNIDPNLNLRANPASAEADVDKQSRAGDLSFREVWHIPQNDAFEMPSSNFLPNGSLPPGGKGKCRYTYKGPKEDPKSGRLECHHADQFSFVYLPLTCLTPPQ